MLRFFLAASQFLKNASKATAVTLALLAMCGQPFASAQESQVLTNADIIKMVQVKLGADVIVQQIRDNPGRYSLTTNSLVQLKQAGVPDKVIAAMQSKRSKGTPQQGTPVSKSSGSEGAEPTQNSYVWDVQDVLDRMTGTTHVVGYLTERPSPASHERLQGIATCGGGENRGLNLLLIYASGTNPPAGFKQNIPNPPQNTQSNTPTTTVTTGFVGTGIGGIAASLIGAFATAMANSAAANAASNAAASSASVPQGPWVDMQMKFDNEPAIGFTSTSQFSNYANVYLGAEDVLKASHSNTLLFALPYENDSPMYFEIRPQEPSFKRLAEKCKAYPPTVPEIMMSGDYARWLSGGVSQGLSVEDFANVLPEVFDAYTAEHHLAAGTYNEAASKLKAVVGACSMITAPVAFSVTDNGVESLDRLGSAFGECSHADTIDLSRLSSITGASGGASTLRQSGGDLLLRISDANGGAWTGGAEKGFFVSVGVGNFDNLLIKNLRVRGTPMSVSPVFFYPRTDWTDGGEHKVAVESYVAGPTWVPVRGNVKVSYRVHTKIVRDSDIQAELLRAPDADGKPGSWAVVSSRRFHLHGDWTDVMLVDKPSEIGKYWYGSRVVDAGHREAREPAPLLVTVSLPLTAEMSAQGIFPPGTQIVAAAPESPQPNAPETQAVRPSAAAPNIAESYFRQGQALVAQATYNSKTGKIVLPPGCGEAFQKYLELAPDGPHADTARSILEAAGIPIKSH